MSELTKAYIDLERAVDEIGRLRETLERIVVEGYGHSSGHVARMALRDGAVIYRQLIEDEGVEA